jgi:amidophosphoribosyltransferase
VFNGEYVTGDVSEQYLDQLRDSRNDSAKEKRREEEAEIIELHNNA